MSCTRERGDPFSVDELDEPGDVIGVRVSDHRNVDLVAHHARGGERAGSASDRLFPLAREFVSSAEVHDNRGGGDPDQRRVIRDLEVSLIVEAGSDLIRNLIDREPVERRERESGFIRTGPSSTTRRSTSPTLVHTRPP
jgi:hypothetical protein